MTSLSKTSCTVVPAWWDPKDRKAIFNTGTIVCGVFLAGDGHVAFASPQGIEFESPIDGLGVTWVKLGIGCRLQTPGGTTHLVYLVPPADGVDRLGRDALRAIAGHLGGAGDLSRLIDGIGDLSDYAGLLGNALTMVSQFASMRQARGSRLALQLHFPDWIGL